MNKNLICIAQISSSHGVKGLIKLSSFTESPEDIFMFKEIKDAQENVFKLIKKGRVKNKIIIQIEGVSSKTESDLLRGKKLYVDKSELLEVADDEFYYEDLVGLKVFSDGQECGIIKAVHNFGAGDLVELKFLDSNKTEYIEFSSANFPEINIEENYVTFIKPA